MLDNNEQTSDSPFFSPEQVKELNQLMRDKVSLVMRLQNEGKIPCASRIPRCHVERKDIPMILDKSYSHAGRIWAYVRKKCKKKKGQLVSVKDFAWATDLDEHAIQRAQDMCPVIHCLDKDKSGKK